MEQWYFDEASENSFSMNDKIQTIINKTKNNRLSLYSKNNKYIYS